MLFIGIYWGLYEYIKKELHLRQGTHLSSTPEEKFIVSYMSGAISGAVAALATTPFDVIKTYQQIDLTTGMSLYVYFNRVGNVFFTS